MAGALIASIPVAIAYNLFLDRFIPGITGGAASDWPDADFKIGLAAKFDPFAEKTRVNASLAK